MGMATANAVVLLANLRFSDSRRGCIRGRRLRPPRRANTKPPLAPTGDLEFRRRSFYFAAILMKSRVRMTLFTALPAIENSRSW